MPVLVLQSTYASGITIWKCCSIPLLSTPTCSILHFSNERMDNLPSPNWGWASPNAITRQCLSYYNMTWVTPTFFDSWGLDLTMTLHGSATSVVILSETVAWVAAIFSILSRRSCQTSLTVLQAEENNHSKQGVSLWIPNIECSEKTFSWEQSSTSTHRQTKGSLTMVDTWIVDTVFTIHLPEGLNTGYLRVFQTTRITHNKVTKRIECNNSNMLNGTTTN